MAFVVAGLSMTATAQRDNNQNRPPKPDPPKVEPKEKPPDRPKDPPKKPSNVIYIVGTRNEMILG